MAPSFPQWQFHCLSSSIWVTLSLCHSLIEPRCWHRPPYQVNNLPDLLWPSQRSQISFDTPQDLPKTSKAPPNPASPLAKALIGLPETLQKDLNQPRRLITPHDYPMILTITSVLCCDALRPRGHSYDPKRPLGSPSRPRQLTDHLWTSKTSRFTKTSL